MRTPVIPTVFVALSAFAFAACAQAQEVKSLRGKPSSDMILQALTPSGEPEVPAATGKVRRRGLSLNNDEPETPAPAPQAAQPAPQTVAAAAPAAVQKAKPRALDLDIQFQFNSDQLTNDGKDVLDQLATALKSDKLAGAKSVILEGHADAKGSASYNQALSLKRAQSARSYLASRHGIPAAKLKAVGKGSSEPADPNNPEDEINRRVRVIVDL